MRRKTSVPCVLTTRPFGATYLALHLTTACDGPSARPDQTVVTAQSGVQVREVVNTTRRCARCTWPARS